MGIGFDEKNPLVSGLRSIDVAKKCAGYTAAGETPADVQEAWVQQETDIGTRLDEARKYFLGDDTGAQGLIYYYNTTIEDAILGLGIAANIDVGGVLDDGSYDTDSLTISTVGASTMSEEQQTAYKGIMQALQDVRFATGDITNARDALDEEDFFTAIENGNDPFYNFLEVYERKWNSLEMLLETRYYAGILGNENWVAVQKMFISPAMGILRYAFVTAYLNNFRDQTKELAYARACAQLALEEELDWAELKANALSAAADYAEFWNPDFIKNPIAEWVIAQAAAAEAARVQAQQNLDDFKEEDFSDLFGLDLKAREQCFLLANIFSLAEIKRKIDNKTSSIPHTEHIRKELPNMEEGVAGNRSVMVTGDTFGLINVLTQSPDKGNFFDMSNSQLSALQPMIRLYKIVKNDDGDSERCGAEREVEIKFDTSMTEQNISDMLTNKGVRNPGVGLKSFNFAYEGDNPFAIKKSISAKLVIHSNSFSELLQVKNGNTEDEYRYVDLALKTGTSETFRLNRQLNNVQIDNLEKLNFRLKVVVGWQNPMFTTDLFSDTKGQSVLNGIRNSAITLNLTPTVHDFSVDDIGRVTFTINYLAYSEDYFDNPNFNIFSHPTVAFSRLIRRLSVKQINRSCDESLSGRYKEYSGLEEVIDQEKDVSLQSLMSELVDKSKIYFLDMDYDEIQDYAVGGRFNQAADRFPIDELESIIKTMGTVSIAQAMDVDLAVEDIDVPDSADSDTGVTSNTNFTTSNKTLSFVYAVDLIDIVIEKIGQSLLLLEEHLGRMLSGIDGNPLRENLTLQAGSFYDLFLQEFGIKVNIQDIQKEKNDIMRLKENYKNLRVLLGPVEVVMPSSFETKIINLGDIPISLKHLMEWLTDKLLKKEQAEYYLTAFLNDFFNTYIIDMLKRNSCYGGKLKQNINLFQASITEYRQDDRLDDTITELCKNVSGDPRRYEIPDNPTNIPLLNVMGVRDDPRLNCGVGREINYLAYYAGLTSPLGKVSGKEDEDREKGIWHYQIGKDSGIVKNINLSKTNSTGLAEVRFEQDGFDGLKQLRVLYDTSIKTYLDVGAFPGTYIYVEPRGFDPSDDFEGISLTELGIGGYCMVWKSEHTIQPGLAETTLHAKWVSSKDGSGSDRGILGNREKEDKCNSN